MSDGPTAPGGTKSLIDRIKDILLKPKSEWDVIEAEPSTINALFTGYAVILAAIGPVARLIGEQVFGWGGAFGVSIKPSIGFSVTQAVLGYALALVGTYALGMIINALAPTFEGTKDDLKAMKVAVYASTPFWLAGIFFLIPQLAFLALLGLYGFYLFYLGLPKLMKVKEDKAIGYIGATIFIWIVILAIVYAIAGQLTSAIFPPSATIGGVTVRL